VNGALAVRSRFGKHDRNLAAGRRDNGCGGEEETRMLLRSVAAVAAVLAAFATAAPAQAGSFGFGFSVQSGNPWYERWHGPRYAPYPPPVYAEPRYYAPALLQPHQVERILYRNGYSRLEVVALRGQVYTVQGVDPWHNIVEMQVSGHDGRVLHSEVITVELYDTPFGHQPPVAIPDQRYRQVVPDSGPRIVGAIPQSPPAMTGRSQPQVVTAPLPRSRPDHRAQLDAPSRGTNAPVTVPGEPEEPAAGERDPLVVY
jgi:hypothetical protein